MCLYITIGRNAKYQKNKKNRGKIPPVLDDRALAVPRPCGRCKQCREEAAREWRIRLLEDIKVNTNGKMVTLTLSNQSYTELYNEIPSEKINPRKQDQIIKIDGYLRDNEIAKLAVKRFRERWRREFGKSIRHWLVTELGHNGTENIHLHGIVWTNRSFKTIRRIWKYGYIWPRPGAEEKANYVSARTVNYSVKYIHKMDLMHKTYKSIVLSSAGMGKNYLDSPNRKRNIYNGKDTDMTYVSAEGYKMAMPKYYKRKLYNDSLRENLWMHTLDKDHVFINGIKIKKNNKTGIRKIIKEARLENKNLGYGTNIPNLKRKKYEHERRKLVQAKRLIPA